MSVAKRIIQEVFDKVDTPKRDPTFIALCEAFPLEPIENAKRYAPALKVLENAIDFLNSQDSKSYVEAVTKYTFALGVLIEEYEKKRFPRKTIPGHDVLAFLIGQQNLTQADLAKELGGQSVVSAILSGKRKLNLKQIKALAKRFGVSPAVFLEV